MNKKGLLPPLAVLLLAACAVRQAALPPALPAAAPEPPAPRIAVEDMIAEAEALFERGGYVHLRRAFSVYRELEEAGVDRSRFAAGCAGTALLLAARAGEMGIRTSEPLTVARELIRSDATLAALESAAEVVSRVPAKTLGVWADVPPPAAVPDEESADRERPSADFEAGPADRPLFAYVRALHREQAGQTDEAKADLAESLKTFPGSLLLKFKRATLPPPEIPLLEEIAEKDPEFFEAFLARGEAAIAGGALLTAEKHLLRARDGVPESPLIAILLAGVNFGTEEYDRSLVFYEHTLEAAPNYKEALLGKAICLSLLGRPGEGVPILEDLLARGPALRGECLYWLAAALHALGDNDRAAAEAEKAKAVLEAAAVYTLAGTIAYERGLLDAAEADLKTAVNLDQGEVDAFFKLGEICAKKAVWMDSALNFMFAGYGYENEEKEILEKIGRVEGAVLPEERKARLLTRKKRQLETARLTGATAFYNAAAGYHNAGEPDRALVWVRRAAAHPYFAGKAKAFISLISGGK